MNEIADVRLIAFYLPQFHRSKENDEWWGEGFTEWTHVRNAKPLYAGHQQPRVPGELGYYDLMNPAVTEAQAALARDHEIHGFCYWHYWFSGRRLLNKPFDQLLSLNTLEIPFCLAWANHSWTRKWSGHHNKILLSQTYSGLDDYKAHFEQVLPAFHDDRYIRINGKPLFLVFMPQSIPIPEDFTDLWNALAIESGLKGIHFVGFAHESWIPNLHGFEASIEHLPGSVLRHVTSVDSARITWSDELNCRQLPSIYLYEDIVQNIKFDIETPWIRYPCVLSNWDNTPRCSTNGFIFHDSSPELFAQHLSRALESITKNRPENRLVFIKSWNEWGEGNYIEPDSRFGRDYLQAIRDTVNEWRCIQSTFDDQSKC